MQELANEQWRRLHNEELNGLNRSATIVRAIKSRRLRWAGHVIMEEGRNTFKTRNSTDSAGNRDY